MSELATLPAASTTDLSEIAELFRKVMHQAEKPLGVRQILNELPKAVRPSEAIAESVIASEVSANRVHKFALPDGKVQFWVQPASYYARQQLLRHLERGPRSQSKLLGDVGGLVLLKSFPKAELKRVFESLQREGLAHKLPPYVGARTALFSASQADPADYLSDALQKLSKKLGISVQQILKSHAPESPVELSDAPAEVLPDAEEVTGPDERIIEAMKELDPRVMSGGMVSIADLRRQLDANLSGTEFDSALFTEAAAGRVAVHRFDRPGILSESELSVLLRDAQGNYYNTVSLGR